MFEHFPETAVVYENASGYIQYSDKALHSIARPSEEFGIEMGIGAPLPEEMNGLLVEAAGAFARFVAIHQKIIKGYSYGKSRRLKGSDLRFAALGEISRRNRVLRFASWGSLNVG